MKIINVQGRRKTGKTTTVTNIIAELCRRGYSVGSIKTIHIDGFTMDVANEDTGKHKNAGADPVTARCHGETNLMYQGMLSLDQVLQHYDNDWVVIEGHVDLDCPNVITARTVSGDGDYSAKSIEASLVGQVNERTICASGVIANEEKYFTARVGGELREYPVINSITDIEALVDVIEARYPSAASSESKVKNSPKPVIIEPKANFPLIESNEFIRLDSQGNEEHGSDRMLNENTIEVYIDGRHAGSLPCTPQHMGNLVLGWLCYEGYIKFAREVKYIEISESADRADVVLIQPDRYRIQPVKPIPWKKEWIFALAADFEIQLPLRQETKAAHNCRLAKGKEDGTIDILFKCEDIGRHSAIDKAVGWGLRNGVDLSECILFTSGRVSRAMVQKVIRAGIPVMAGKGTISKKAVQLARENDLTLIGYSKTDSLCVFNQKRV